jgi:hypothetical protein
MLLPAFVFYLALGSADHITTSLALRNPNIYEVNPRGQTEGKRLILTSVGVVGLTTIDKVLVSHKKSSKFLRIAAGIVWGGAAINNAHNALKRRK